MEPDFYKVNSFLRINYAQYTVIVGPPVSYIETLTGQKDKVLFVCKYDLKRRIAASNGAPSNTFDNGSTSLLDLTGSPLKDECQNASVNEDNMTSFDLNLPLMKNHWKEAEELYQPLPNQEARTILQNVLNQDFFNDHVNGSVWILCLPTETDRTILMECNIQSAMNSRGFVSYGGLVASDKINIVQMKCEHGLYIKGSLKCATSVETYFNITPNISFKLNWNSSFNSPLLDNYKSANVVLTQTLDLSFDNLVCGDFWEQLFTLDRIKNIITVYKENAEDDEYDEPVYIGRANLRIDLLKEQIIHSLTEEFLDDSCSENNDQYQNFEIIIGQSKVRQLNEITDKLWDILKRSSNYKDLKSAFNVIFQCAAKGDILNMPINNTCLAQIIRDVAQQRLAVPCLTATEPLELLLEIGLEKIAKDYEYIFKKANICDAKDLEFDQSSSGTELNEIAGPLNIRKSLFNAAAGSRKTLIADFNAKRKTLLHNVRTQHHGIGDQTLSTLGVQNSKFDRQLIEHKLSRLGQIHLILEHLCSIQAKLALENVYSIIGKEFLQQKPKPFTTLTCQKYDRIEIEIGSDKILHLIKNKEPDARRIVFNTEGKRKQVKSVFFHSLEPLVPPFHDALTATNIDLKESPKLEFGSSKTSMYHYLHYVRINTHRF